MQRKKLRRIPKEVLRNPSIQNYGELIERAKKDIILIRRLKQIVANSLLGKRKKLLPFTLCIRIISGLKDPAMIPVLTRAFKKEVHGAEKRTILFCFEAAGFLNQPAARTFLKEQAKSKRNSPAVKDLIQRLLEKK